MISLLINTIRRYDNLEKILKAQLDYDCIDEIIVMNNGGQPISVKHDKLKVITPSWDVGLRSRWVLGTLAKNDCLCVQDDDLIVDRSVIELVYSNFIYDHDKVYGIYGRQLDLTNRYNQTQFFFGNVDLVLTRLAMFHKRNIPYLLEAEERILPFRYPDAKEFPYDDILLSFMPRSVYNKKPKAIPVDGELIQELGEVDGLHKDERFMDRRSEIIKKCKAILCHERVLNTNTKR